MPNKKEDKATEKETKEVEETVAEQIEQSMAAKPVPAKKSGLSKQWLKLWLGAGVLVILLIILLIIAFSIRDNQAVATFEGGKITRAKFEEAIRRAQTTAQGQAIDFTDLEAAASFQEQLLQEMITVQLLLKGASQAGIEVSQEDADAQYNQILIQAGSEAALASKLSEIGVGVDELREDIADQLMIEQYIAQSAAQGSLAVSVKEVEAFYENTKSQDETTPPLDEVRGQIQNLLQQRKLNEAAIQLVSELRANANVEILL